MTFKYIRKLWSNISPYAKDEDESESSKHSDEETVGNANSNILSTENNENKTQSLT
jgi:hypothetical protein